MQENQEDELSEPIDSLTSWSLILAIAVGAFWGIFFLIRKNQSYELAFQLFRIGYSITPFVAGLSLLLGVAAHARLRRRGFAKRGLAIIAIAASSGAILAWALLTLYRWLIS